MCRNVGGKDGVKQGRGPETINGGGGEGGRDGSEKKGNCELHLESSDNDKRAMTEAIPSLASLVFSRSTARVIYIVYFTCKISSRRAWAPCATL